MPAIALSEQIDMGFIKKDYDVNDAVHSEANRAACLTHIVDFAMTAEADVMVPFQRTNKMITSLGMSLFLVSHGVHEVAHKALLENNTFSFIHLRGTSGLGGMTKPCAVGCGALGPLKFKTGTITLGHESDAKNANAGIVALTELLESMPIPMVVDTLNIRLVGFYDPSANLYKAFLIGLANRVKVTKRLTVTGLDVHLSSTFHKIPDALDMCLTPVFYEMHMRSKNGQIEPFHAEFVPAKTVKLTHEDVMDPDEPWRLLQNFIGGISADFYGDMVYPGLNQVLAESKE